MDYDYDYLAERIPALRREKGAEDRKVEEEVFDRRTLMAFYKLMKRGVIKYVEFPISTGKEGNVFRGVGEDGLIAIKVYRMATSSFTKSMWKYIYGDHRFEHVRRGHVVYIWTQKEYRNLRDMFSAGLPVPMPIDCWKNILVMEYIGDEDRPAPLLKDAYVDDYERVFHQLVDFMKVCYTEVKLIHGDLSEFNVLMKGCEPYVIDVGQAVPLSHPEASTLLLRDVSNLVKFFKGNGVRCDVGEVLRYVKGDAL